MRIVLYIFYHTPAINIEKEKKLTYFWQAVWFCQLCVSPGTSTQVCSSCVFWFRFEKRSAIYFHIYAGMSGRFAEG